MNEPVADHARAILDGHCVLSRSLAHRGHYPAINVLESVSRLATEITSDEVRRLQTAYRGRPFLLFPEDRLHPIRMTDDIIAGVTRKWPEYRLPGSGKSIWK